MLDRRLGTAAAGSNASATFYECAACDGWYSKTANHGLRPTSLEYRSAGPDRQTQLEHQHERLRQQIARMEPCRCGKAERPPGVVFQVQDRVYDPDFGLGTVQQVIGVGERTQLVIDFDDVGQRSVTPSFRPRMLRAVSGWEWPR